MLTINGKAELVVQDAASYQRLFDLAERLETIQAVKDGLASADRGEGSPMDDVFDHWKRISAGPRPVMTYHVVVQPRAERDIHLAAHWILGQSGSPATALRWARNLRRRSPR